MKIKDSIVIITGASSGIGEATARLLAKNGAKVALVARSKEKLESISNELPNSFVAVADMTSHDSIKKMVADVKKHYERIDVLINNAGRGSIWQNIEKVDIDEFKSLMDINVYGPIIAMQEIIPIMRAQGGGSIVNIGSGSIHIKKEGASVYPGSKVLLNHISHISQLELAKDNIKVSIIHPYITKTNFFKNIKHEEGDAVVSRPDFMEVADSADKVAKNIMEAIETGVEEIDMTIDKMKS